MKPICVPCHRFFRVKRNGFKFLEGMPVPHTALPGLAEPEKWKPYKLWMGDLWECPGCHAVILNGFGTHPVAIQHESDFLHKVELFGAAQFQVNDC
jgi:hypothetical protein